MPVHSTTRQVESILTTPSSRHHGGQRLLCRLVSEQGDCEQLSRGEMLAQKPHRGRGSSAGGQRPGDRHPAQRQHQNHHHRHQRRPGQDKLLLQRRRDRAVHPRDRIAQGQHQIDQHGQPRGGKGGEEHAGHIAVQGGPCHRRHQIGRRGGRAAPVTEIDSGQDRPRGHGHVDAAGAGQGHKDDPRRAGYAEGGAQGIGHDGGQEKRQQEKQVRVMSRMP